MGIFKTALFWVALPLFSFFPAATAYTSYPNAFVDPNFILAGKYDAQTQAAQQSIIAWADELNAQSPWCKFPFAQLPCHELNESVQPSQKAQLYHPLATRMII